MFTVPTANTIAPDGSIPFVADGSGHRIQRHPAQHPFDMTRNTIICFIRERHDLGPEFSFTRPSHNGLINVDTAFLIWQPQPQHHDRVAGEA